MQFKQLTILTLLFYWHPFYLNPFDLPVHYRTPFLQKINFKPLSDGTSVAGIRCAYGSTHCAHAGHGQKVPLLSYCGPIDMKRLGLGVLQDTINHPITNQFWGTGLDQTFNGAPITSYAMNDGLFDLQGHLRTWEIDIYGEYNVLSGLFAGVYAPIRHLSINNIYPIQRTECPGKIPGCCPGTTVFDFNTFVQNNLDPILQEQGIAPLKTPFHKTGISELLLGIGWQGGCSPSTDKVIELTHGRLLAGVLVPLGSKRNENIIASLPLGYNNHWGFHGRINAQASLGDYIGFGASLGGSIFLKNTQRIRMRSDLLLQQEGIISLGKGNASVDLGSVWDGSGYIELKDPAERISLSIGYSYARQETSHLKVRDHCFLNNVLQSRIQNQPSVAAPITKQPLAVDLTSKETIVNADERLLAVWIRETIHIMLQINFKKSLKQTYTPSIMLSYDHPCEGSRVFQTKMFAGTTSLSCAWKF